jgi:hypothetical protein
MMRKPSFACSKNHSPLVFPFITIETKVDIHDENPQLLAEALWVDVRDL